VNIRVSSLHTLPLLNENVSNVAIATDSIYGFLNETEDDFDETIKT
jgi:tRNA A37 methylthiotransferase MiaB